MAYEALINAVKGLPEASIYDLIAYVEFLKYKMKKIPANEDKRQEANEKLAKKRAAFRELENMRKEFSQYEVIDFEEAKLEAMEEKYAI